MKFSDFKNSNTLLDNEQMKNVKGGRIDVNPNTGFNCQFKDEDRSYSTLGAAKVDGYTLWDYCYAICKSSINCDDVRVVVA